VKNQPAYLAQPMKPSLKRPASRQTSAVSCGKSCSELAFPPAYCILGSALLFAPISTWFVDDKPFSHFHLQQINPAESRGLFQIDRREL